MCGIGGIRQFGANPITREEIITLLCELERRGNHATGVALLGDEGVVVHKEAVPAWNFVHSDKFKEFLTEYLKPSVKTAILHTRFATVGNPEFNANNHPIWDGETAIVHNGHVSNHNHLFTEGKFKRMCETDSDVIRAMVHEYGMTEKCIRVMSKMAGSAAIACIDSKMPEMLMLARSGSPLIVGMMPDGSKMYWASEARPILKASRPFRKIFGVWAQESKSNVCLTTMPDNTAWVFEGAMMKFHSKFDVCSYYRAPDYSKLNASFHEKTKKFKKEKKEKVKADEVAAARAKVVVMPPARHTAKPAKEPDPDRPLPNSLMQCSACGEAAMNINGVPWDLIDCPTCGQKMLAE